MAAATYSRQNMGEGGARRGNMLLDVGLPPRVITKLRRLVILQRYAGSADAVDCKREARCYLPQALGDR